MIVVEYQEIELDHCIGCKGTWFDQSELGLLFSDLTWLEDSIASLPQAQGPEAERRCPVCRKTMKKMLVGERDPVLLDGCRSGDGIWFDAGEVGRLVRQLSGRLSERDGRTLAFLGEVFQNEKTNGGPS